MSNTDMIMALVSAGFTKADIVEFFKEAPKKEEVKKEIPKKEMPDLEKLVKDAVAEALAKEAPKKEEAKSLDEESIVNIMQRMNAGKASIDLPPKYNQDKAMEEHLMGLLGVKKKEDLE